MLTLSRMSFSELATRLQGKGVVLRTGPFTSRIRTDIPRIAEGLALLYADYPVDEAGAFADFQISLMRSGGWRRWFRPQVRFRYDGAEPFVPLPLSQAFVMFEWVLNWCVANQAHSYLIVHAAVVEKNGYACILPAPPGSGKSTLCAGLVSRGWRLLSDELTLVRLSDDMLVPVPRPVSLKNASLDVIRAFAPGCTLGPPVGGTMKGTIGHMKAPRASIERAGETVRPACIVFPRYEAGAATQLEALPAARTFTRLADNAFNYTLLGLPGFEALGRLVDRSTGFEFCYSELEEAIAIFDRLAEMPR